MSRLCIVPAKPLAHAKARLSPAFSAQDRQLLALAMLRDVITAARACGDVWVLCSDPEVEEAARLAAVVPVRDATPGGGLNRSLAAATAEAVAHGYDGVLVLSSDLPCVASDDVAAMLQSTPVAVAPSADGGTNALWRTPPGVIATAFGRGSLVAHAELARAAGVSPLVVDRPGLALDVDTPEDLDAAVAAGVGPATTAALSIIGGDSASRSGTEERYRSPRR